MMITRLAVRNLRILASVELEPSAGINLVVGVNGSGKTSLLEAIYVLASGHSFRTRRLDDLLRHGAESLMVTGAVRERPESPGWPVGLEKSGEGTRLRLAGEEIRTQAEIARRLPVQAFHPESHRLISGGPKERRQYLDWGVFHVEHGFLESWRRYQRALRQRNAALRRQEPSLAIAFDAELAAAGETLSDYRRQYVEALSAQLPRVMAILASGQPVAMRLRSGWPEDRTLAEALSADFDRDLRQGYTHSGAHRADLELRVDGHPVADVASRGQQKAVAAALVLLQVQIYNRLTGQRCITLIDDLPSELDGEHRTAMLRFLKEIDSQIFVSAIEREQLDLREWEQIRVFHVEQGALRELV
jgi:DNA replication and repair protein RecF